MNAGCRQSVYPSRGTLFQERDHSLKLSQEALGEPVAGLSPVEPEGLGKVLLGSSMKRVAQLGSA